MSLKSHIARHDRIFDDAIAEYQHRFDIGTNPANHSDSGESSVGVIEREPSVIRPPLPDVVFSGLAQVHETGRREDVGQRVEPDPLFTPRVLFRPLANLLERRLPAVDSRLGSSDSFRGTLLRMLENHQARFTQAEKKRQKEFDDGLQERKDLMTMQDLEDDRAFKQSMIQWQRSADSWELEYNRHFNALEKERNNVFLEAERARDVKFLNYTSNRSGSFTATMSKQTDTFYALAEDMQTRAYESEGARTNRMAIWRHLKKEEVKMCVEKWKKKYASAEAERCKVYYRLLQSVEA
ncbi:hypothetical protein EIP91_003055 [Steccherinum ochraceum]|uniref:Uncharacterized protein n=1 Tax=Steccherinum ochraceum TaxID=92696 RepID=A0A4R0RRN9_9APHY|nr:hypothetical protein EIP91_003055 [Steccherinum ochraceum]